MNFVRGFLAMTMIGFNSGDYQCDNKPLHLHGQVPSSVIKIFSAASPANAVERKKFGRNVSMERIEVFDDIYESKQVDDESTDDNPILFSISDGDELLYDNQIKFPIVASAMVIVYNLPGVTNLKLSINNLADIYNGKITLWNDSDIAENNPNVTLPEEMIKLLARQDADDSTHLLLHVLCQYNDNFDDDSKASEGSEISDVNCVDSDTMSQNNIYMYTNMDVGMAGCTVTIPFTLGYVFLPQLLEYKVKKVKIISMENGEVVEPSPETIRSAMNSRINEIDAEETNFDLHHVNNSNSYQLSSFTYMILNKSYTDVDCCKIEELIGFIDWFLFEWEDQDVVDMNFVPLIEELKMRVQRTVLQTVTCDGELMYPRYVASKLAKTSIMKTWEIAVLSILAILLLSTFVIILFFIYTRKYQADEKRWLIDARRIKVVQLNTKIKNQTNFDNTLSIQSINNSSRPHSGTVKSLGNDSHARGSSAALKFRMVVAEMDETYVFLDKLEGKLPQQWKSSTKRWVTKMKNMLNGNTLGFMGVTVFNKELYAVHEYGSKGTLHYVLNTCRYNISDDIKYQFAIDAAAGMKYLHKMGIINGQLNSLSCYLDSTWTVKVAQWKRMSIYIKENTQVLVNLTTYNENNYLEEEDLIKYLYLDHQIKNHLSESVDIFSFGFLLVEIFTQKLPYMEEVEEGIISYSELLQKKFHENIILNLKIKNKPKITTMSNDCVGFSRPSFQKIHSQLKSMTKISTGIIDIVMEAMDKHAENLEEKIEERTLELKQVTNRMRLLLNEVLPQQIAEKLFNGEPVLPEFYECVTIYFSDIVGFTSISARSTPIEVMTFLNDLWLAFDAIIDKFDCYKVDTIGDAYMVCSGLPCRNRMEHCKNICFLSLALLDKCNKFKIAHLPKEILKIRIGINSGPVTTGVVGSKMPQYCVFGDTVNTAARMESTSIANCIQISNLTHDLITNFYPTLFETVYRGETSIKGKGKMQTYWLQRESNNSVVEPNVIEDSTPFYKKFTEGMMD